jgi:hypothetical protein
MHKKKTDWSSCAHCEPGQFKQVSFYVNTVNGGLRAKIMTIFSCELHRSTTHN